MFCGHIRVDFGIRKLVSGTSSIIILIVSVISCFEHVRGWLIDFSIVWSINRWKRGCRFLLSNMNKAHCFTTYGLPSQV